MVEQKLEVVINNLRYLPDILEKEFSGMELSPGLSISDCWDCMVHTLLTPKLEPFWKHCGFTDSKTVTALLNALRSAVLTACIYYGINHRFDSQFSKEEPEYFSLLNTSYIKHLFGFSYLSRSASSQKPHPDSCIEFSEIEEKSKKTLQNAARIYDPYAINPLQVKRQLDSYASEKKGKTLTGYFPEIDLFLQRVCGNIVPEDRESDGKMLKGWLRYDEGPIRFHTPLWAVFFLLTYHGSYLPGHRNTDQGGVTLHSLADLDISIQEIYKKMISANLLAPEADGKFSKLLTDYGLEDLLHLNRLSGAVKQCIDYVHDKEVKRDKKEFLPLIFSTLVYAPSLEVQDFMKNDVALFADAVLYEPRGEVLFPAMQRVLSISSIVFPSLVCIFSGLLYLKNDQISPDLVDARLSRISSDNLISKLESSFACKGKTWDDPLYFCKGLKYTQGHKKGEQIKFSYRGQNDFPPDYSAGTIKAADRKLPLPDDLLLIMMKQHLSKNGTIIIQNQLNTNVFYVLHGWEIASKVKYDEEFFLLVMILRWLKMLEILPEPPGSIDMQQTSS